MAPGLERWSGLELAEQRPASAERTGQPPAPRGALRLRREHCCGLLAALVWGSYHPIAKLALVELGAGWITFARMALGLVTLVAFGLATGSLGGLRHVSRADLVRMAGIGVCGSVLSSFFITLGLRFLPAAVGALLANSSPLVVAVVAPLLLGEPMGRLAWAGLVVGLAGVAVLLLPGADPSGAGAIAPVGMAFSLCGAIAWAFYTMLGRQLLRRYHAIPATLATTAFGLPLLFLVAWLEGGPLPSAERWWRVAPHIVWMGFVSTGLGFAAWMVALSGLRAAAVSAFQYLIPVFAMVFAFLLLGERPTPIFLLGAALVLLGVAAAQVRH